MAILKAQLLCCTCFLNTPVAMLKATLLCYTGFLHTPVAISKAQLLCYIRFQAHSSRVAMLKQHYYATRVFYTLLWLYSIMLHAFSTHFSGYIKSNITMLHVFSGTLQWLYSIMLHAFSTHFRDYIKSNISMLHAVSGTLQGLC